MLVTQRAVTGTLLAFSFAKTLGMSFVFAAVNMTSAQINDQAR
jgi:hypothetical protein